MPSRIGSPYPGGPRRPEEDGRASGAARRPTSSEEKYDRSRRRRLRRRKRKRARRAAGVVVLALVAAAGIGYLLGEQARTDVDGIREADRGDLTTDELITTELNRVLLELWKMEELERR